MEALAALGLAGNVLQFIDFSCKLFDQARTIHGSSDGASQGAQDLETITNSLRRLCEELTRNSHAEDENAKSTIRKDNSAFQTVRELKELARGCQFVANELIAVLDMVRSKDPSSKRSSFRASLALVWKEKKILSIEKQLDSYRRQIAVHLQVLQRHQGEEILRIMQRLELRISVDGIMLSKEITDVKSELRSAFEELRAGMELQSPMQSKRKDGTDRTNFIDLAVLARTLLRANDFGASIRATHLILESLRFQNMEDRYAHIHEAHRGTYEWAFSNDFVEWLQSSEPLFWITGKPGSGKSTLMKHIVGDPRTRKTLESLSGGEFPIIASYFYWIKGTKLQRSQEGVLRSLLYKYLCQSPDVLLPKVFPELWKTCSQFSSRIQPPKIEWSAETLMESFKHLATLDKKYSHMCMFIDGLDEYEGDHRDVIDLVRTLSNLGAKICVASRPWNVFQMAFESVKTIRMQDVNEADIQMYVKDKLCTRPEIETLKATTIEIDSIVEEITEKSQGVFLWVVLVVRSLVEGLLNQDPVSLLRKRVREFPSDLWDFFRLIFESLEPIYRPKTAQMFQSLLAANTAGCQLTTLTYWFLDELDETPDMALKMSLGGFSAQDISEYSVTAGVRINGRCKGLLELSGRGAFSDLPGQTKIHLWHQVEFLHRTVVDFLETAEIQPMLKEWQNDENNLYASLCHAKLAEIKVLTGYTKVVSSFKDCFRFAECHEKVHGTTQPALLRELESTVSSSDPELWLEPFIAHARDSDLLIFVKNHAFSDPRLNNKIEKKRLLSGSSSVIGEGRVCSLEMICLLHSIGPSVDIDEDAQDHLRDSLRKYSDAEALEGIAKIARYAYFDMKDEVTFASEQFQAAMVQIQGSLQGVEEFIRGYIRPTGIPHDQEISSKFVNNKDINGRTKDAAATWKSSLYSQGYLLFLGHMVLFGLQLLYAYYRST